MSNETKFTPAPWKYVHEPDTRMCSSDQHFHKILAMSGDCEFRVASINVFEDEDIANAKLIESAPALYNQLKEMTEAYSDLITRLNTGLKKNISCIDLDEPDYYDFEYVFESEKLLAKVRGEK